MTTTDSIAKPIRDYVFTHYLASDNPFKSEVLSRAGNLVGAIAFVGSGACDAVAGTVTGIFAIVTAGTNSSFYTSMEFLDDAKCMFSKSYYHLLLVLNPSAEITGHAVLNADGILAQLIRKTTDKAFEFYDNGNEKSFAKRVFATRLTLALAAGVAIITRIADGVLAIPLVILSAALIGTSTKINTWAYRALRAPGILEDLTFCIVKCINPAA